MRVEVSPRAFGDLNGIAEYTRKEWSEEAAIKYVTALEDVIDALPSMHRLAAYTLGYQRWRYEHHVIYFRVDGDALVVVRILHERMLPSRHL